MLGIFFLLVIATELGIDVYMSTPEVQKELNRLGWAAAIANWTPTVLLLPAAGTAKVLYTVFDWTEPAHSACGED